jgi:hypothetical protein
LVHHFGIDQRAQPPMLDGSRTWSRNPSSEASSMLPSTISINVFIIVLKVNLRNYIRGDRVGPPFWNRSAGPTPNAGWFKDVVKKPVIQSILNVAVYNIN